MKSLFFSKRIIYPTVIAFLLACSGCGSSRKLVDYHRTAAPLRYVYPVETTYNYSLRSEIEQTISIPQRDIHTSIQQDMKFTIRPGDHHADTIHLGVMVDSVGIKIRSPQGLLNPDLNHLSGREFELQISAMGEGISTGKARSLEFEIAPGTKRNLEMLFAFLWPKLPRHKVRVGDAWTLNDTITEQYEGEELKMILTGINTFASIDTVNDVVCARILVSITGQRSGSSQAQGVPMSTNGVITGSGSFYLALDGGYLLKDKSEVHVDGSLTVQGPQVETYPLKMMVKSATELRK